MFFAALISAFLIVKSGMTTWPPIGQPRLPVFSTAINSLILLFSGWLMYLSKKSFLNKNSVNKTFKLLNWTIVLGAFFVVFQGVEWVRLIQFGLTMTSDVYGSFFYLIIGCHAVHVVSALILLIFISYKLKQNCLLESWFSASQIFWYFVVGIWPVLYVLVYLS